MAGFNLDLSEVTKAQEVAAQEEANAAVVEDTDVMSTGHKVVFGIAMGVLALSGIGIPVLIFMLIKQKKKTKQLQEQLDQLNATGADATEDTEEAEEKSEPKPEEGKKTPKK